MQNIYLWTRPAINYAVYLRVNKGYYGLCRLFNCCLWLLRIMQTIFLWTRVAMNYADYPGQQLSALLFISQIIKDD